MHSRLDKNISIFTWLKFNPQIEGLRAVAVIGVLIEHLLRPYIHNSWLNNLPYGKGVMLFFVISGYLITYQIFQFKEKNRLEGKSQWSSIFTFYMRRVLRIFPLYYVLILFLLIIGYTGVYDLWPWLITYNVNFKMGLGNWDQGSYTHLWSLGVEEKFYLIWIWIVLIIPSKKTTIWYVIICLISLGSRVVFEHLTKIPTAGQVFTISNFFIFVGGAFVAYLQFYHLQKYENLPWKMIGWLVLSYFVVLVIVDRQKLFYPEFKFMVHGLTPLITVFFVGLVALASQLKFNHIFKWILENPIMQYIGKISYGIYIFHLFMPPLWTWINGYLELAIRPKPLFAVLSLLTIGFASLSWFLLEKPFLLLKRNFKY